MGKGREIKEFGLAHVSGMQKYFGEGRVVEKGKKQGQVEIRLVSGKKAHVLPEQIIRQPGIDRS